MTLKIHNFSESDRRRFSHCDSIRVNRDRDLFESNGRTGSISATNVGTIILIFVIGL